MNFNALQTHSRRRVLSRRLEPLLTGIVMLGIRALLIVVACLTTALAQASGGLQAINATGCEFPEEQAAGKVVLIRKP